jgi:hypothetical protein
MSVTHQVRLYISILQLFVQGKTKIPAQLSLAGFKAVLVA